MTLQVCLFGEFRVLRSKKTVKLRDSTTRALFAYLMTRPNRSASRSEIIREFWSDLPDATARRRLSLHLTYLRAALGKSLDSDRNTVSFGPTDRCWIDVEEFQKLVAHAEEFSGEAEREHSLQKALTLYRRGEFLADYYGEWSLHERERLKEIYIRALKGLIEYYRGRREWDSARAHAHEWTEISPLAEEARKELILLQWAQHSPQAALREYEEYARLCETEGLKPSDDMRNLQDELLRLVEASSHGSSNAYSKRFVLIFS